jgi:ribonuclease R
MKRKQNSQIVRGRVDRPRATYAFIRPEGDSGRDIFVPSRSLAGALHGDRVAVRLTARRNDGRREGTVTQILERAVQRVTGRYRRFDRDGEVEPFDHRYAAPIHIPAGSAAEARDGEIVGCELTRMPVRHRPGEGRIVEVLGLPDEPESALRAMIWKHKLRDDFPERVLEECANLPDEITAADLEGREDFRHLPAMTIDPPTAQDHDDAITLEPVSGGNFRIGVHIADVDHFVPEGSHIDSEARLRGTSVYFPGACLPMLPEPLSSRLCSLLPDRDRLTLSVRLEVRPDGSLGAVDFRPGVIRSRARLTYGEVAAILEDVEKTELPPDLSAGFFRDLETAARALRKRRLERGSIDLDLPDPELILDEQGRMIGVDPGLRNFAHIIIEEFMLAANEAVARRVFRSKTPSLFRIHERPNPIKLEVFNRILEGFGLNLPGPYVNIRPAVFQDLLRRIQGLPEERVLTMLLLRSMQQAQYSEEPREHFGLAMPLYTHFTSPIRRYPDLVVHRILKQVIGRESRTRREKERMKEQLAEFARHGSRTERIAAAAEREMTDWKKIGFLAERLGDEFDAYITGVAPIGCFVSFDEYFIDGLIPMATLPEDRYRCSERKQILQGTRSGLVFRVGDRVRVRLDRVAAWPPRIDCSLVGRAGAVLPDGGLRRLRPRSGKGSQ